MLETYWFTNTDWFNSSSVNARAVRQTFGRLWTLIAQWHSYRRSQFATESPKVPNRKVARDRIFPIFPAVCQLLANLLFSLGLNVKFTYFTQKVKKNQTQKTPFPVLFAFIYANSNMRFWSVSACLAVVPQLRDEGGTETCLPAGRRVSRNAH